MKNQSIATMVATELGLKEEDVTVEFSHVRMCNVSDDVASTMTVSMNCYTVTAAGDEYFIHTAMTRKK